MTSGGDSGAGGSGPEAYLAGRFREQLTYFSTRATSSKQWHEATQIALIVVTAAVPVTQLVPVDPLLLRIAAAVLGGAAVVIQGVRSTMQYHENWLASRGMEQFLQQERSLYLNRVGDYAPLTPDEAFKRFVEAVEAALKSEHGLFQAQHKQAVAKPSAKSG